MRDLNNYLFHLLTPLCFNFKYLKRLFCKTTHRWKQAWKCIVGNLFLFLFHWAPCGSLDYLASSLVTATASEVINKWMLRLIRVSVRTLYRTHNFKIAGLLWIQLKYLGKKVGKNSTQLVAFTCWSIFNNSKIHAQYWIITPNKHVLKVPYISQANQYMHTEYFGPVTLYFWINIMAGVKEMQVRLKTILNCSHFYK